MSKIPIYIYITEFLSISKMYYIFGDHHKSTIYEMLGNCNNSSINCFVIFDGHRKFIISEILLIFGDFRHVRRTQLFLKNLIFGFLRSANP